jgi:hypothetical protein
MRTIVIFAHSYNDGSGGIIALHKLCDIVNAIGGKAYLVPYFDTYTINKLYSWRNAFRVFNRVFNDKLRELRPGKFKTHPHFTSPVLRTLPRHGFGDDHIVVYPQITFGNPLQAKNVVRWLLHNPGAVGENVYYGPGEIYFKYHAGLKDFNYPGSVTSKNLLKVIHFPFDVYNNEGASASRKGTAYCIRKGRHKTMVHDLNDSILIDGKSHAEIADIFKRVKTFISYDAYTAFSRLAVLCGCESVVIPDEGVGEEEWRPDPSSRYGIAYGFENLEKARQTAPMLKEIVEREQSESVTHVARFMEEANTFFSRRLNRQAE